MRSTNSAVLNDAIHFTKELYQKGGPLPEDYALLNEQADLLATQVKANKIDKKDLNQIWSIFSEEFMSNTLQGHSLKKPYGYAGDFKIIDMIYTASTDTTYAFWDNYYNQVHAAQAVRNRKRYFKKLIVDRYNAKGQLNLLNVASGPCRDLKELFEENDLPNLKIHCIEYDQNAITYAKQLCADHLHQITFEQGNIYNLNSDCKYDFIWSAGLFDYFNDAAFITILQKLLSWRTPQTEVVIGNFTPSNPSKNFMEILLDWHLYHRDTQQLFQLAIRAGCQVEELSIGTERAGVNLFLHVNKSK